MFHLHYSVLLIWTIFQDFLFLATKDLHSKKKAYCIYIILYLSSVHSACLIADLLVCPSLGRADRTISAAAFTERKKSHLWLARLKVSAESGVVVLRHRRFMVSVVSEFSGHWSHLAKALILSSVISVNLCLHPTATTTTITTFHMRTEFSHTLMTGYLYIWKYKFVHVKVMPHISCNIWIKMWILQLWIT